MSHNKGSKGMGKPESLVTNDGSVLVILSPLSFSHGPGLAAASQHELLSRRPTKGLPDSPGLQSSLGTHPIYEAGYLILQHIHGPIT